jgi:hypothetical protein
MFGPVKSILQIEKDQLIKELEQWNFLADDPDVMADHLFEKYGIDMQEEQRKLMMGFAYKPKSVD